MITNDNITLVTDRMYTRGSKQRNFSVQICTL